MTMGFGTKGDTTKAKEVLCLTSFYEVCYDRSSMLPIVFLK
jgi:hypothetical protein